MNAVKAIIYNETILKLPGSAVVRTPHFHCKGGIILEYKPLIKILATSTNIRTACIRVSLKYF